MRAAPRIEAPVAAAEEPQVLVVGKGVALVQLQLTGPAPALALAQDAVASASAVHFKDNVTYAILATSGAQMTVQGSVFTGVRTVETLATSIVAFDGARVGSARASSPTTPMEPAPPSTP